MSEHENHRYVDFREKHLKEMLKHAREIDPEKKYSGEIISIGHPRDLPVSTLEKIYNFMEQVGVCPEKGKPNLNFPEFLNLLQTKTKVEVSKGELIVDLEPKDGQEPGSLKVKGRVNNFYQAYFVYEKRKAQFPKNKIDGI